MKKSDEIKNLAAALSKAQGELKPAIKDSENPFFKSTYADLTSCWEAARAPLAKNGLSVTHIPVIKDDGKFVVAATLFHSSGEYIEGEYPVIAAKQDAQSLAAAVTYARRASFKALVGVTDEEDDDGNTASGHHQRQEYSGGFKKPSAPAPVQSKPQVVKKKEPSNEEAIALGWTSARTQMEARQMLARVASEAGWSQDEVKDRLVMEFNKGSSAELTWDELNNFMKEIENSPKRRHPNQVGSASEAGA